MFSGVWLFGSNLCFPVISWKDYFQPLFFFFFNGFGPPVKSVNYGCHSREMKYLYLIFLYPKACCKKQKVNLNSVRTSLPGSILCLLIMTAKFTISLWKETQWKTALGFPQMWVSPWLDLYSSSYQKHFIGSISSQAICKLENYFRKM